jgi:hypothetical protein
MYDPQIGRFHTVDPLAEWHFNYTPYAYCFNNPVSFIDPTGMNSTNNVTPAPQPEPEPTDPTLYPIDPVVIKPQGKPTFWQKLGAFFRSLFDDVQGGGIPFTTNRSGAEGPREEAKHPDPEVNIDDLMLAMPRSSVRVTPNPLNMAKAINKAGKAINEIKGSTSDKKILKQSTGNTPLLNSRGEQIDYNGKPVTNPNNYPPRPDIPASPIDRLPDSTRNNNDYSGTIFYWADSTKTYYP